jgi:hypothetical protein
MVSEKMDAFRTGAVSYNSLQASQSLMIEPAGIHQLINKG